MSAASARPSFDVSFPILCSRIPSRHLLPLGLFGDVRRPGPLHAFQAARSRYSHISSSPGASVVRDVTLFQRPESPVRCLESMAGIPESNALALESPASGSESD